MANTPIDLTALVGSRICHDLISPLGAISNGVELLSMTGALAGPEMALISESVENANARIRFFRIAFGAAGPDQEIGRTEILSVLNDVTRGGRLRIDWRPHDVCARQDVKLAFLLIQCLESAMPYGGKIEVSEDDDHWTLTGSAEKMKIVPETWAVLADVSGALSVSASEVHFGLVPELLQRTGKVLETVLAETRIEISF